uniref:p450 n=1 Tax=Plagiochasma appendiculatum TaxID=157224 RepID=A0A0N9H857_9MARC|nr:P450 [Plagiochasma appendiculatum]
MDTMEAGQRLGAFVLALSSQPKLWAALVIGAIAWLVSVPYLRRVGKKLPPGPPVWPVLGSLAYLGGELHHALWALSKKHGDVMRVGLGQYTLIVVSSAEAAEELMKKRDSEFCHRSGRTMQRSAARYIGFDAMDIAFSEYNPHLRMLRKLCTAELFTVPRLNASAKVRTGEIEVLLGTVRKYAEIGKPIELREYFHSLTMNIMCLMMFGKRYYGADVPVTAELQNFKSLIIDSFDTAGRLNLSDLVWCLRPFDVQGINRKWKTIRARCENLFGMIIEEHRQRRIEGKTVRDDKDDFVDVLLSCQGDDKLTDKAIIGLLSDMVLGGTDTTATTLEWCMVETVRNPQMMKRLQEEIDAVVGKERGVEESDIPQLPYLAAFVKEVFRLHTPLPITLPRLNDNASSLGGFYIPPECTIFVNVYAIAHDERYWERPMEFNPDRFLGSNINLVGNDFQLVPFGSGRRKCVGIALGMTMVQRTLAAMVHSFDFTSPQGVKPHEVDVSEKYLIVLRNSVPLKISATPRLPAHVYHITTL